ncbi:MAG: insulinase family protein [Candidatus Marinimicrobia bacterium]|nr:insulinase family protein [Candidatus Neomarinimicrobiota bacterium]
MNKENFQKTILKNGVTVISENIDTVHSVSLGYWLLVGSINETEKYNGMAHMLEHMVFKRTQKRDSFDVANDIESLGGILNAFTSKSVTCYYVRLMNEDLETGVDVLSDIVINWQYHREDFKKEKTVIFEEIKSVEDNPSDLIFDLHHLQLFPNHSLGRPIQGTWDSVQKFSKKDVVSFYKNNYTTKNLLVTAAGRVNHAELVKLVEKYTADMPTEGLSFKIKPIIDIQVKEKEYKRDIQQSHMLLGRRIFAKNDPRRHAISLLNILLSGGLSSRFFNNIRERYGFIYSIYSMTEFYLNEGDFSIYVATDKNKIDFTRKLIYKEMRDIADKRIDEKELLKVKQQFKGSAMLHLESMQSRMSRIAKMEIFEKELQTIDQLLEIINGISASDIQDVATYLYDEQQFVESRIVPAN